MTKTNSTSLKVPFMKALIKTTLVNQFYAYLNHKNIVPDELPAAYDEFVVLLSEISDDDGIEHLRKLNYTKIELSFLKRECDEMKDGRHALYDAFIHKSLALLDTEIEIVKEFYLNNRLSPSFQVERQSETGSGKKVVTLTWNGTDNDLIELVAALMAAGVIGSVGGKKVTVMDVIKVFEEAFHIKINALYTKRGKVFDRSTNTTPFIDSLRKSYNRMLEERLA